MGEQGAYIGRVIIWLLATVFGAGLSPIAPGTIGTALGIPISLAISRTVPGIWFLLTLILVLLSAWISGMAERVFGKVDDRRIVLDEMVAYPVCMLWIKHTATALAFAFLLFRLLDILKPQPIAVSQRLRGGIGVIADDLVAAIITNLVLGLATGWEGLQGWSR